MTGLRDHTTVGRATDEAFHRARRLHGPGLRRLVHGAIRASVFQRWNASREARALEPWDATREYHLRPVPDELIGVEVDTSSGAPGSSLV